LHLHRPETDATPKELDLLEGTELERPSSERNGSGLSDMHGQFGPYPQRYPQRIGRRHRPGKHTSWILTAVVALAAMAAGVVVAMVFFGGESVIAPEPEVEAPLTLRELGRDPGPTARPNATDVITLDYYGLAPAESPVGEPPNQTTTAPADLTLRALGRDPGPTARPNATDVITLDHYGLTEAPTVAAVPRADQGRSLPQ